jgi:integrase
LTFWLPRFEQADAESYVFPFHKMGMAGNERESTMYDLDLGRPTGSWRTAWINALKVAGVPYRWHDLRHTFISRLAENPTISEQTIRSLAGHVSRQMLERYSHIRSEAKQSAIQALEEHALPPNLEAMGHKSGHSDGSRNGNEAAKSLKTFGGPARI